MNILFGLIPALGICFVATVLVFMKKIQPRTAAVISILSIVAALFSSLQTYGPRVELAETSMPYAPERTEVETGSKLVDSEDRFGKFDNRIEAEKVE